MELHQYHKLHNNIIHNSCNTNNTFTQATRSTHNTHNTHECYTPITYLTPLPPHHYLLSLSLSLLSPSWQMSQLLMLNSGGGLGFLSALKILCSFRVHRGTTWILPSSPRTAMIFGGCWFVSIRAMIGYKSKKEKKSKKKGT